MQGNLAPAQVRAPRNFVSQIQGTMCRKVFPSAAKAAARQGFLRHG
jgi:hypothetical protein